MQHFIYNPAGLYNEDHIKLMEQLRSTLNLRLHGRFFLVLMVFFSRSKIKEFHNIKIPRKCNDEILDS